MIPKLALAASVPVTDWNNRLTGGATVEAAELGGDVGQAAGLGRDLECVDELVECAEDRLGDIDRLCRRVDADHGVTAAVEQAVGG